MLFGRIHIGIATAAVVVLLLGALAGLPYIVFRHDAPLWGFAFGFAWLAVMAALCTLATNAGLRVWIGAAVLLFLVSRIAVFAGLNGLDGIATGNDYAAYSLLADNLLSGQGLLTHTRNFGWVRGMYPPLYPLLLAGDGFFFGVNATSVMALNSAIDLGCAFLLWRIGTRLDQPAAGRVAALLYLFWPSFVLMAPLAQKEGLTVLLTLSSALILLKIRDEGVRLGTGAALGLNIGLLALTQPGLTMLPVFMGIALLWRRGWRNLLSLAARALPLLLVVLVPWWARNWLVFGAFVPLTTSSGPSMFIAATGQNLPFTTEFAALSEPARSAFASERALSVITADPFAFLWRRMVDFSRALFLEESNPLRLSSFVPPIAWARAVLPTTQLSYACLCGLASIQLMKRGRERATCLVSLLVVGALTHLMLVSVWFEFGERHRQHFVALLILLASCAVAGKVSQLTGARREPAPRLT